MSSDFPSSKVGTTPAERAFVITPNDDNNLAQWARALIVGVAGNVNCIPIGQNTAVVIPAQAGVLPVAVKRVLSTSTTATGIVGLV